MMKKITMLPIEPLDSRYSKQWYYWFADTLIEKECLFKVINPTPLTKEIQNGAFLDVCGTNYYKAAQLQEVAKLIHTGKVDENTVFLLHDAWFPGIEMLAYMRNGLDIPFKIVGCLHAGTYDSTDFVSKKGMGLWGKDLENSWFNIYDSLFVATNYHKNLIVNNRNVNSDKIHVTGFPIRKSTVNNCQKEKIVVFPHRLTSDKRPDLFDKLTTELKDDYPDWKFIKSQEVKRTKTEFYELLNKSAIAVSFAEHENWGIGMQEAVMSGCIPLVPDRLSYREMYFDQFKYSSFVNCLNKISNYMSHMEIYGFQPLPNNMKLPLQAHKFHIDGVNAIPNMLRIVNEL